MDLREKSRARLSPLAESKMEQMKDALWVKVLALESRPRRTGHVTGASTVAA